MWGDLVGFSTWLKHFPRRFWAITTREPQKSEKIFFGIVIVFVLFLFRILYTSFCEFMSLPILKSFSHYDELPHTLFCFFLGMKIWSISFLSLCIFFTFLVFFYWFYFAFQDNGESYELYPGTVLTGKILRDFWKIQAGDKGDSLFVKLAAHVVWGPSVLKTHSVSGRTVRKKQDGKEIIFHRPALDQPRMMAVVGKYSTFTK